MSYRIALIAFGFATLLSFGQSVFAQEPLVKSGDKVAFLGDSITQGGAGHPAGYVRRVESGLQALLITSRSSRSSIWSDL